jgi:hypothetical protein
MRVYTKERGLRTLKEGITLEEYREKYPDAIKVKPPSVKTLEKWDYEGYSKTPCGCKVEPDGICQHGNPTWLDIILF